MLYSFDAHIKIPNYKANSNQFFETFAKIEGKLAKQQGKISIVACYDSMCDITGPTVHVYSVVREDVEAVRDAFVQAGYIVHAQIECSGSGAIEERVLSKEELLDKLKEQKKLVVELATQQLNAETPEEVRDIVYKVERANLEIFPTLKALSVLYKI